MNKWLIIGVSGVTCGGKTTIANSLNNIFPESKVISQDDFFLPVDDQRHVMVDHLNHINFDILSSLDMEAMLAAIKETITCTKNVVSSNGTPLKSDFVAEINPSFDVQSSLVQVVKNLNLNVLIIEGFCIFDFKPIRELCNLKYFVTLSREECYKRRIRRVYEPPDCPGYFEDCAWPEYILHYENVKRNVPDVRYFSELTKDPLKEMLLDIWQLLQHFS